MSHVDVTVGTIDGGCELSLTFAPNASRDGFVLLSASWNLDNFCPGLGDQDQALYILSDAGEAGMTGFNVTADPTATDACVRQTVAPYGEIVLQSGSSFLTVDLGALSFVGDFSSTGVDGVTCACPYGFSGADCTACGARFEEPNCNVCNEGFYGEGCAYSCEEGFAPRNASTASWVFRTTTTTAPACRTAPLRHSIALATAHARRRTRASY